MLLGMKYCCCHVQVSKFRVKCNPFPLMPCWGKKMGCVREDSRMWKINSTGLNNQRKIFSFETHEHFNIGSKLLWEKQTWPPKLIFYALVEERLSIWSSGPSVHLIGNLFTQWNTTDICQLDNVVNIPPLYARFNCWWQTDRRFHWTAF